MGFYTQLLADFNHLLSCHAHVGVVRRKIKQDPLEEEVCHTIGILFTLNNSTTMAI
jgi:hypothetical protein